MLGARPEVSFEGPVDNTIPQHVADHLLAVVREALTNAGKHAHATRFLVTIRVAEDLTLEIVDDGVGIEPPLGERAGLGLGNLRNRAEKLGGTFDIRPAPEAGTRVVWQVPL
jgi:signal transduction histidine kinase